MVLVRDHGFAMGSVRQVKYSATSSQHLNVYKTGNTGNTSAALAWD